MTALPPPPASPPPISPTGSPTDSPATSSPAPSATERKVDLWLVFRTEYRLILRTVATRGRLIAISVLALLSVLTAALVSLGDPFDPLSSGVGYVNTNVASLIPVAVLVFGAATLGDLLDDGSLVYLWLRPVPAWIHVLAAWAVTCSIAVPLTLVPVVAATTLIHSDVRLLGAAALAGSVAIGAYGALFVTAGVRFRRALPWGLVYILIWEGFVASAGETATRLAIRSYVRSILSTQTGVTLKLGEFNLASGILVPVAVIVVVLAYASRRLGRTDVA